MFEPGDRRLLFSFVRNDVEVMVDAVFEDVDGALVPGI